MPSVSTGGSGAGNYQYDASQNYTGPLAVLTSLFFIWALVTNLNDILIPHLKKACDLTDFQSSLVQSAFFGAYFVMSIPAGAILKKVGYKNGILVGLGMMLIGALLFIPAASTRIYLIFLGALFIMASGVTLLQVAANAYVAILGPPETSSSRLNLTQAFNSLGASLGPLVGGWLILSGVEKSVAEIQSMSPDMLESWRAQEAASVIFPYTLLAGIIALIALLIKLSKLPKIDAELEHESETQMVSRGSAFDFSHLTWGVVCIFFYVGAEVAIASFLIRFAGMPEIAGIGEKEASSFPSFYMFGAMIGRFLGAGLMQKIKPQLILTFNALGAILLILIGIHTTGSVALWAIVLVGFCNSIMFPTIFTLGIKDLGIYTKQGSSFLIMAIVGGAVIPPLTGWVSDMANIQIAFWVPCLCYLPILYFAIKGHTVKTQNA